MSATLAITESAFAAASRSDSSPETIALAANASALRELAIDVSELDAILDLVYEMGRCVEVAVSETDRVEAADTVAAGPDGREENIASQDAHDDTPYDSASESQLGDARGDAYGDARGDAHVGAPVFMGGSSRAYGDVSDSTDEDELDARVIATLADMNSARKSGRALVDQLAIAVDPRHSKACRARVVALVVESICQQTSEVADRRTTSARVSILLALPFVSRVAIGSLRAREDLGGPGAILTAMRAADPILVACGDLLTPQILLEDNDAVLGEADDVDLETTTDSALFVIESLASACDPTTTPEAPTGWASLVADSAREARLDSIPHSEALQTVLRQISYARVESVDVASSNEAQPNAPEDITGDVDVVDGVSGSVGGGSRRRSGRLRESGRSSKNAKKTKSGRGGKSTRDARRLDSVHDDDDDDAGRLSRAIGTISASIAVTTMVCAATTYS